MSRYKYTIALGLIMAFVVGFLVWRWTESRECESSGGHYVHTFGGWECIR